MYFDVAFALISILSCHLFLGCSQNLSVFPGYDSSVTGTSVLLSREKEDRTGFPFYRKSVSKICFSQEKTSRRSLVHWVCDPNREIAGGQFCLSTHCDLVVLDPLHFRTIQKEGEREIRFPSHQWLTISFSLVSHFDKNFLQEMSTIR